MKDVVQEDKTIAEFEGGRPEFLGRELPAQLCVVEFREMPQGWLTATDEFEARAVDPA